jgi:23S rRNA pseudouridine1911/1915/1917 synthase
MTLPDSLSFEVESGGQRLDRFLVERIATLSRTQLQRLVDDGRVLVNGGPSRSGQKLERGQHVSVLLPPVEPSTLMPEAIDLPVLYEDTELVVVDKPAGMVVHPGHGVTSGTLVNALMARYPDMQVFGASLRPGIAHRLDKDTSGLMVIARNPAALHGLQHQFAQRTVRKMYLALLRGKLETEHALIEAAIGRSRVHPTRMAIAGRSERAARTEYYVAERFARYTLVEARPITGRTHQIRLHFAALGHPIAGDTTYGADSEALGLTRQFLHASTLSIRHPSTGAAMEFYAELPPQLQQVLDLLRGQQSQPW